MRPLLVAVSPGCAMPLLSSALPDFVTELRNLLGDVVSSSSPLARAISRPDSYADANSDQQSTDFAEYVCESSSPRSTSLARLTRSDAVPYVSLTRALMSSNCPADAHARNKQIQSGTQQNAKEQFFLFEFHSASDDSLADMEMQKEGEVLQERFAQKYMRCRAHSCAEENLNSIALDSCEIERTRYRRSPLVFLTEAPSPMRKIPRCSSRSTNGGTEVSKVGRIDFRHQG